MKESQRRINNPTLPVSTNHTTATTNYIAPSKPICNPIVLKQYKSAAADDNRTVRRRWQRIRRLCGLQCWLALGACFTLITLRVQPIHLHTNDSLMTQCVDYFLLYQFQNNVTNTTSPFVMRRWAQQWCQEPGMFPIIPESPPSSSSSSASMSRLSFAARTNATIAFTAIDNNLRYNKDSSTLILNSSATNNNGNTSETHAIQSLFNRRRWRRRKQKLLQQQLSDVDALDAEGRPGYVADPTSMKRWRAALSSNTKHNQSLLFQPAVTAAVASVCRVPPGLAEEGPWGIQGIWKIRQALMNTIESNISINKNSNATQGNSSSSSSTNRILCLVYTHSARHETVLQSIVETWASACDGFLAISNQTNANLGAVHILHPGEESYTNMWLKVRSAWLYVSKHYLHSYDWFHIGGDDHYLIPQNLRRLTSTLPLTEPVYMGASMTTQRPIHRFCGGGAGYTINGAALRLLSLSLTDFQQNLTASAEDRLIGLLFSRSFYHLSCRNTNDLYNEPRYHHLDINFHAAMYYGRMVPWNWRALEKLHNISTYQVGLQQISNTSISFHLSAAMIDSASPDRGMRRYHALLFGQCGPAFDEQMQQISNYTHEEVKERLVPGFRKYKQKWAKTKDRCAEAITSRNKALDDGAVAQRLCRKQLQVENSSNRHKNDTDQWNSTDG